MANHDSNHSSTQRTMLWIIIPGTIFVSLLFTRLNHKIEAPHGILKSDFSQPKKSVTPKEEHAMPSAHMDTLHLDTAAQHAAPEIMHAEPATQGNHEAPKH